MIQVTKVWRDGEKLMAEPIDPTTIYQEPAQEKDWGAVGEAHIAAIKKSSKAMVEDAAVRAVHKVMVEFEAKSDERLMGPPAQQEPVYVQLRHKDQYGRYYPWGQTLDPKHIYGKWADGVEMRLLYTAPQPAQRKPLTEEEIDELSRTMVKGNKSVNWLCRAIEATHGIKENT